MNHRSAWQRVIGVLMVAAAAAHTGLAAAPASKTAPAAQWITLGTVGGPPVHAQQAPIANALVVGDAIYLFDVGNSVLRQLDAAGLSVRNVRGVFVTHHHVDHNADLGFVMVQVWTFGARKPVPVLGPPGTAAMVAGLASANAATEMASAVGNGQSGVPMSAALAAKDLSDKMFGPTDVFEDENIRVAAITVEHFQAPAATSAENKPSAVAYRVEAGGRSIVYTGDTGPTKRLQLLAKDADLLISEVVDLKAITASLKKLLPQATEPAVQGMAALMANNHLEPEVIGQIAADSNVKSVVLTHYVPGLAEIPDAQALVRRVRTRFNGTVRLAHDLDRF